MPQDRVITGRQTESVQEPFGGPAAESVSNQQENGLQAAGPALVGGRYAGQRRAEELSLATGVAAPPTTHAYLERHGHSLQRQIAERPPVAAVASGGNGLASRTSRVRRSGRLNGPTALTLLQLFYTQQFSVRQQTAARQILTHSLSSLEALLFCNKSEAEPG